MSKYYSSEDIEADFAPQATAQQVRLKTVDFPFCLAAFLSFLASIALWFMVDKLSGIFVGIWVPSILALWCGVRSMINDPS